MTYPITEQDMRAYNESLVAHLPRGPMHDAMIAENGESPRRVFEALVAYYNADEPTREDIRSFFYAVDAGESWVQRDDGPTSGQLAEQTGQIEVPDLPADLVTLCRTKLMPLVQEHSPEPDVDNTKFVEALHDMGIAGSLATDDNLDEDGEDEDDSA
jgi:hypothetical protein